MPLRPAILTIFLFLMHTGKLFSQGYVREGTWKVISANPGFKFTFNSDSTNVLVSKSNLSGNRTQIQKFVRMQAEGIIHTKFESRTILKKGDTCTYYVVAYLSGKPTLYYSQEFTGSTGRERSNNFSRSHYLPKGTDSMVVGLVLSGYFDMPQVKITTELIKGQELLAYKKRMLDFSQNPKNIEQLATVCKTWGILKYFSPEVLNKDLDWDEMLMSCLADDFERFETNINADLVVNSLLTSIPIEGKGSSEKLTEELYRSVYSLPINSSTKRRLLNILSYAPLGKSKYFTPPLNKPFAVFHERNIDNQILPDARARVLSLFRYWNIINYFYPYKLDFLKDWDITLTQFIPKFIVFDSMVSYNEALLLLNASIGDGHTAVPIGSMLDFYDTVYADRQLCILPFTFRLDGSEVYLQQIDSNFSKISGLKPNDELVSVNEIKIAKLAERLKRYISDPSDKMKNFYLEQSNWLNILPTLQDTLRIRFRRAGTVRHQKVPWSMKQSLQSMTYFNNPKVKESVQNIEVLKFFKEKNTLYINPWRWNDVLADSAINYLNTCDRLVIDCRVYPDWSFLSFAERLIKDDVPLVKYRFTTAIPGKFDSLIKRSVKDQLSFDNDIYLLISEKSKSRSEFLAMILKSGSSKIKIIGRRTAGADGDVTSIPVIGRNKLSLRMSNVGVEFPDGTKTQQVGIQPDVVVKGENPAYGDTILSHTLMLVK